MRSGMKGVTPVIAVILLLLITIAIVGFAFIWFTRVANTLAGATERDITGFADRAAKKIQIDNVNTLNTEISIKNIGTVNIPENEISVYVGGVSKSCTIGDIVPGGTNTCIAGGGAGTTCSSSTAVKVVAPGNFDEVVC